MVWQTKSDKDEGSAPLRRRFLHLYRFLSISDQAACNPGFVRPFGKNDLVPYVSVFRDLLAGCPDFRAIVQLTADGAVQHRGMLPNSEFTDSL